jgi:predicted peptidase
MACERCGAFSNIAEYAKIRMTSVTNPPSEHTAARRRFGWLEGCLILSLITLTAQFFPDILKIWREWPRPGHQVPRHAVLNFGKQGSRDVEYLLYLPQDYSSKKLFPVLLFLHGSGRRGGGIENAAMEGPPYFLAGGKQLPIIVISPHCREGETWDSEQLLALLDYVQGNFSVDIDRVYVGGNSMGGYGTWALACYAPERFAAAIPVSGHGDVGQADRLVQLPIWAFHGSEDKVVAYEQSKAMVDAVNAHGGKAELTTYERQGHGIEKKVFSRDDLYDWLLEQHRPTKTITDR